MDTVVNWITGDLTATSRVWLALAPAIAASSYFLLGFVVYVIRYQFKGAYHDEEFEKRGETLFATMGMRLYFIWLMQPFWRLALKTGVPPVALTTLSALVSVASGVALAAGRFSLGGWLFIASGVLDILDGRLARASGQVTKAGGALDSILDRYADAAVLSGLAWFYRDTWVLAPVLVALAGTSFVPYIRAKGESLGLEVKVGVMQRAERIMYLGVGCAMSPLIEVGINPDDPRPIHRLAVIGIILLAVATQVTAFQRLVRVVSALADSPVFVKSRGPQKWLMRKLSAAWVATAFDLGLVIALVEMRGFSPVLATAIGCVLGGVVNFSLARTWAFDTDGAKLPQMRRYAFVSITSALLNASGVWLTLLLPAVDYWMAWLLVRGAVALAWNFPLHRDYVFKKPTPLP